VRWPLLRVSDLSNDDVTEVLVRARYFADGGAIPVEGTPPTVGLIFYETSLRTRVGFSVAAHRLGAHSVDVYEPRASPVSMPESWADTLHTLAGYCEAIVGRPAFASDEADSTAVAVPYINGGDRTADAEHPTQALIDLFAMERLTQRPVRHVTLIGDPGMRSARSLARLLDRSGVDLVVVTADEFAARSGLTLPRASAIPPETDVVYVTGMAHESIDLEQRGRLLLTGDTLAALHPDCIVLSPMPVIDEIAPEARTDDRIVVLEESHLGLFVRMALLSLALDLTSSV
jgi:aspartate carbamoyltransferase catalytic subunit